jgi:hypothetical protein
MDDYKALSDDWGSKARKADSRAAKSTLRKVAIPKVDPVRYFANDYAGVYGVPMNVPLRAKFSTKDNWVDLYLGRKKVFGCNRTFFDVHFWEANI